MKKLTCHCGAIEAKVNVSEKGFEKVMNERINQHNYSNFKLF